MSTTTLRIESPVFHEAQNQVLRESRRFNVAACGRRWGKTTLAIDLLIEPALDGYPVGYFTPTYKMLAEVWRESKYVLREVVRRVNEQERRIELITGGVIDFWSLDKADVARGRKYKRVILDEAAVVNELGEAWNKVIRPTLTDLIGDAWFFSTPAGYNDFYELFRRGVHQDYPDWQAWQIPTTANPFIDPNEIAELELETPPMDYAQEFLAEFTAPGGAIFLRDWWDGVNRYDINDKATANLAVARGQYWDTAQEKHDAAAFTSCVTLDVMPGNVVHVRDVYRARLSVPELQPAIERIAQRWNYDRKLKRVRIEKASTGGGVLQNIMASSPEWLQAITRGITVKGSKEERAKATTIFCAANLVKIPWPDEDAPWVFPFEEELLAFPQSQYMDQVDALTLGLNNLKPDLQLALRGRGYIGEAGNVAAG